MPTVPRLDRPQVATRPLPTPQTTPMAEGGVVASALQVGAQVVGGLSDIVQQERRKAQMVLANEAEVRLRQQRDALLYDADKGALTKRGLNARTAPEEFASEWTRAEGDILRGITDPEVRENVRLRALATRAEAEGIILRHIDAEREKVDAATTAALVADAINTVVRAPEDTAAVDEAIAGAVTLQRQRLDRQGVPESARDADLARLASNARLQQIDALLAKDDIEGAESIFTEYGEAMVGDDLRKARALVADGSLRVKSQRATDGLIAEFGKDGERAALAAARERYEGEERDEVVRRVEMRYADERRLFRQELEDVANRELTSVEQGRGVSAEGRQWLVENNQQGTLRALRQRERQVRMGLAVESDLATLDTLETMPNSEFIDVNLADYRDRLAERDYVALRNRQGTLRRTGGRGGVDRGMSDAAMTRGLIERSASIGLIPPRLTTPNQVQSNPAARETIQSLRDAIDARVKAVQEDKGRDFLLEEEETAILNAVFDDLVMKKGWFGSQVMPRAIAPEDAVELTPEQRARFPRTTTTPPPAPNMSRRDRYLQLIDAGVTPAEAEAQVRAEMPNS